MVAAAADLLRDRNRDEAMHVGGTSAGAAILSEHMIAYGEEGFRARVGMAHSGRLPAGV